MPRKLPFSDQTLWLEERAIRPEGGRWARPQEATYIGSSFLMVSVATACCSLAIFTRNRGSAKDGTDRLLEDCVSLRNSRNLGPSVGS